MRITESLLVQCPRSTHVAIMDESTGAEILVPMDAIEHLIEAVAYFHRVSSQPDGPIHADLPKSVFPAAPPWEATAPLWEEPTRVRINPNLRLNGTLTMVDLDEDVSGEPPKVGQQVEVYTGEPLDWTGTGRVTTIDRENRTLALAVDWPSLEKGGY